MDNISLAKQGATAILTIDRPKALNALNAATLREMDDAISLVATDAEVRALIITGAGEKAFVAGADISEMSNASSAAGLGIARMGHRVFSRIEALPIPSIAAVNGFALGGGCELALACDLIYASETASFGLPEVGLGIIPGFGGTQRLPRRIGVSRAKEMIFTGERVTAASAAAYGLVLAVLPSNALLAHCLKVAEAIGKRAPLAIAQAKSVMRQGANTSLEVGNELELQAFAVLFGTSDAREGIAAFLEKRPAKFAAGPATAS